MKEFTYDWFGLNEILFSALYAVNFNYLDSIWNLVWYAYGYIAVAIAVLGICARYLVIRQAEHETEIQVLGEILGTLFLALAFVVCIVVTVQNIIPLPRPWEVLPGGVDVISLSPRYEGFPATNAAIAVMLAIIFWRYASRKVRSLLIFYAMIGCLTSVIVGIHFPADTIAGALIGWLSVYVGRYIMRVGMRIVAMP